MNEDGGPVSTCLQYHFDHDYSLFNIYSILKEFYLDYVVLKFLWVSLAC
jgi:hypothetical protein